MDSWPGAYVCAHTGYDELDLIMCVYLCIFLTIYYLETC